MFSKLDDGRAQGNPRAASVRIGSDSAKSYSGQRRHDLRIGAQPDYVDADRGHLNRILMTPPSLSAMRQLAQERRAGRETRRAMKSNAAIATAGIITFGSEAAQMFEALPEADQNRAFRLLARAVAMRLETSLHGLVVHCDEATIHAHFTLSAYNRHGVPLSKSTRPAVLSELQDLTAKVMQRFCPEIERGTRYGARLAAGADFADVVHKSVKQLHRELPSDLAAKQAQLSNLVAAEAAAQARVEEMQARVQKLVQKAALSAQEAKRLETYRNRLEDRLTALQAAQDASEAARREAERLTAAATEKRAQEEHRASQASRKAEAVGAAISMLMDEVQSGTLRRGADGKLHVRDAERYRPAFPEIRPVLHAAADLVGEAETMRQTVRTAQAGIEQEREQIEAEKAAILDQWYALGRLRDRLQQAFQRVMGWMRKPDFPAHLLPEERALVDDVTAVLDETKDQRPKL